MKYAVIGGDLRFAHLARMLQAGGHGATAFLLDRAEVGNPPLKELKRCDCIISNWPMRWPLASVETSEEEILENIAPGSTMLLCGPKFPQKRRWDLQYVNLWEDETLLCENAYLTAEAAIATAMARGGYNMAGLPCAVVGYGRIGRALVEILLNLGASVVAISGKAAKRKEIEKIGAKAFAPEETGEALRGAKLIFSTPPSMVIDRAALEYVDADAQIVDLASPPYGVDLEAAQEMGLKAGREPGLPGRYCPLSAARAIYSAILRWEEGEKYEI